MSFTCELCGYAFEQGGRKPVCVCEKCAGNKGRLFPLQTERGVEPGPLLIPWEFAEKAYEVYAAKYGKSQSLEQLAARGGFSWGEMDRFYPKWRTDETKEELEARVITLEAELESIRKALHGWPDSQLGGETGLTAACRREADLAEQAGEILGRKPGKTIVDAVLDAVSRVNVAEASAAACAAERDAAWEAVRRANERVKELERQLDVEVASKTCQTCAHNGTGNYACGICTATNYQWIERKWQK